MLLHKKVMQYRASSIGFSFFVLLQLHRKVIPQKRYVLVSLCCYPVQLVAMMAVAVVLVSLCCYSETFFVNLNAILMF